MRERSSSYAVYTVDNLDGLRPLRRGAAAPAGVDVATTMLFALVALLIASAASFAVAVTGVDAKKARGATTAFGAAAAVTAAPELPAARVSAPAALKVAPSASVAPKAVVAPKASAAPKAPAKTEKPAVRPATLPLPSPPENPY